MSEPLIVNAGQQANLDYFAAGVDQGLEEAACVVDTACHADESLRKLAQAIRDLKRD